MNVVAAVDCGATSVRVCRVDLDASQPAPEVVHRVAHELQRDEHGHLRWDWHRIVAAVGNGLERCLDRGPLASIGIDTWAVDYGLLDDAGALLGAPYSYRDHRTDSAPRLVEQFGAAEMYRINGLQYQPFNTIFQLAAHDRAELARAECLLWLPELLVHELTGVAVTEATSAGSSGLLDVNTGQWSDELVALAGVEQELLGEIEPAGRIVGEWRDVPVALVGGHDTASAVAGMGRPAGGGSAFAATGTWMLVGVERDAPDTSDLARERNFTNEAGALGGFRFLRNVTGFWLLEQCRAAWGDPPIEDLVRRAEAIGPEVPIVDVDDETLRAPDDMLGAYTRLAGVARDAEPALVARSIVESTAARTAEVIAQLAEGAAFDDVVLFGGAARIGLLARRLCDLTGLPIRTGPAEAAAIGNALVQGVALGVFTGLEEGRNRIFPDDHGGSTA